MTLRVAELESLFTANTKPLEQAILSVETRKKDLTKAPATVKVDSDVKGATAGMDRVEEQAKKLVAADVVTRIDANIAAATKKSEEIKGQLRLLEAMDTTPQVDADITKAKASLAKVEASLKDLTSLRARVEVVADTSKAEDAVEAFPGKTKDAGESGGKAFLGGFLGGLASIPVVGAITGLAGDIGEAFVAGFQVEVRSDRLMATTGLDPETVAKLARAAGEAYASNWGESIDENMDTARLAVQTRLLNPASTVRDAQAIIASLEGVADIVNEEVARVARSTAQLIKNGLAKDAQDAFDLIVKGQQAGLNVSEDWLDTLDEYSTKFRDLGLTGPQALGLLSQAAQAGARDTDVAADALKEFAIRAQDGSDSTASGFDKIGLNSKKMAADVAAGGSTAAAALEVTLERLRAVEDPVLRDAAAVELFGTKAEDMGDALYSMDLSNAVQQLGNVAGAAQSALDTIGDNAAGDIETARRNIETAAQGIQGALAAAFNPQIEDFATWVSGNREQVMQFLLDIANGGLDAGRAFVNGTASATEAVGGFVAGPLADLVDGVASLLNGLDNIPGVDTGDAERSMRDLADSMRGADEAAGAAADAMRTELIENGIDPIQRRLNDIAIPIVNQAAFHDASVRMASALDQVGYAADGSRLQLALVNDQLDVSTDAGREVAQQIIAVREGMEAQTRAAIAAGESQEAFTQDLNATRDGLVAQLEQMGLTHDQAVALADAYGAIPDSILTTVEAETAAAQAAIDRVITSNTGRKITLRVSADGSVSYRINGTNVSFNAAGNLYEAGRAAAIPMGAGGLPGTSLDPAQMVRPGQLRIVGDRVDVDEAYIPLDGSPRSMRILAEAIRRMPGLGLGDGGVSATGAAAASWAPADLAAALAGLQLTLVVDGQPVRAVVQSELTEAARGVKAAARRMRGVNR